MFFVLPLKCTDVCPPPLLLRCPLRSTGTTEHRMTKSFEVLQHFLFNSIPKSIWSAIGSSAATSFQIQDQRKTNDREGIFLWSSGRRPRCPHSLWPSGQVSVACWKTSSQTTGVWTAHPQVQHAQSCTVWLHYITWTRLTKEPKTSGLYIFFVSWNNSHPGVMSQPASETVGEVKAFRVSSLSSAAEQRRFAMSFV